MSVITLAPLYIFLPNEEGYYTSFADVGDPNKIKIDYSQQAIMYEIFNQQKKK